MNTAGDTIEDEDRHSTIDQGEAEIQYTEAAQEQLLPPPDFRPFYTLVEDPDTGEHSHPQVHYVFSDDDLDGLTTAALEAIDAQNSSEGEQQRFVVVDLAPDGRIVQAATSWSEGWQAVSAQVEQAPNLGNSADSGDRGLMLKIAGREVSKQARRSKTPSDNLEGLIKTFSERLVGLEEVLDIPERPHTGSTTTTIATVTNYDATTHEEREGTE